MLFNSIDFAIFLPIVFSLYWLLAKKSLTFQNWLLVLSSYIFYGWWDWRFLSLILFSSLVDYFISNKLKTEQKERKRKSLLWLSILINLGFLGFFKYYNFFLENFVSAFSFFGSEIKVHSLQIILPVGISFYTFQTMSYTIDVYRRKLEPTNDFVAFSAFVSFFPQLVAGPIERATHLLPQFSKKRRFDYSKAVDGMRQILWGLFKKIVIADNCAEFANHIFNNSADLNGSSLFLGAVFFTFQIYGDFSGYSDIAVGTSRLFGFDLMRNFAFPYFSRDFGEFWRRWHISLSTWFRDYLYIPLGGSRVNKLLIIRNTFIIFIVSGFWHGANWTFIFWGILHAIYFLPLLIMGNNRKNLDIVAQGRMLPSGKEMIQMSVTFGLTIFAWIFFRAKDVEQGFGIIKGIFSKTLFIPNGSDFTGTSWHPFYMLLLIGVFVLIEWLGRENQHALERLGTSWKRAFRYTFYYSIIIAIFWLGGKEQEFIYFQF